MSKLLEQRTAAELAAALDTDDDRRVVDTRPPDSYDAWHLPGAVNIPYHPVEGLGDGRSWESIRSQLGDTPVAVVGGKGLASIPFGIELARRGHDDVAVVKGGMEDWSKL